MNTSKNTKNNNDIELETLLKSIDDLVAPISGNNLEPKDISELYNQFTKDKLINQGFNDSQISEVQAGINLKLRVDLYAKVDYNWEQMYEIRMGLMDKLDISLYSNKYFSAKQMHEIRMGLIDKLDVTSYASLSYGITDMKSLRHALIKSAYKERPNTFGKIIVDEKSGLKIRISDDFMQAFIILSKNITNFTAHDIIAVLKQYDIVHGLVQANLNLIAEGHAVGDEILVAQGNYSEAGKNGWYECFFEKEVSDSPVILENGKADYSHVVIAEAVVPGETLIMYHNAKPGKSGFTINGIEFEGSTGEELPLLTGTGFTYNEKSQTYIASENGYVSFNEAAGILNVWKIYVIPGDVNRYNGNVSYDGVVHVQGSVSGMTTIEATGDVLIDGFIEGAMIKSGANVVIKGGVNADGEGYINADGNIIGNFFESAKLIARGNIEGNYFLNCIVKTHGKVLAQGKRGRIMGGEITATQGVESTVISNFSGGKTIINVGDTIQLQKKLNDYTKKSEKVINDIEQLNAGAEKIKAAFSDAVQNNPLYLKILSSIAKKEAEQRELKVHIDYLNNIIKKAKSASIIARGDLKEDVTVIINGNRRDIQTAQYGVTLTGEFTK